eukprot:TRINITY_DN64423_c0_g1_i1.p1 TRINITY_DN64423_c0_g1~~TRINITY_DN64423_c0_g1_i1.p1  ORF type:complete len:562 (-),score=95.84 TRINITY_DN64423_c0_g1_i1:155-1840(-)
MALVAMCLVVFLLGISLVLPVLCVPPPSSSRISLPTTARIATYDDISTTFNLVYAVTDSCPSSISFGEFTNDERQFPILPLEDIVEDEVECSGDGPLNFVTELTVTEPGLLGALRLQAFQDAIDENANAARFIESEVTNDLLVGWHSGTRTCGDLSYPTQTIYFIIREDKDYNITFTRSESSERVTIPPDLRSLLVVAPQNQICLLVDETSNPDQDVTLATSFSNGTESISQLQPGGIAVLSPPNQPASGGDEDGNEASAADSEGDDTNETDTASGVTSDESAAEADPSASPSSFALPSASPDPSIASVLEPIVASPSPSDFGSLVASPSAVASAGPSTSPFISVVPVASAVPPGAAGEASFDDDLDSTSEEDSGSACFPASAVVRSERGDLEMHKIEIGDRVMTGDGLSDVVLFTHRHRFGRFEFVRLSVKSGRQLTVSAGHYVFTQNGRLVAASSVVIGDVLRMANHSEDGSVVGIEKVFESGLYNPQTESGSMVVDGFMTSTYTTAVEPKMAHMVLLAPVRGLYKVWRWPVEQLSSMLEEGSGFARWMPRGEGVARGL